MKLTQIRELLNAQVLCCDNLLETEVLSACATDFMSDALAYIKDQGVMLTGMVNPQVIRTAEMLDTACVVFVRGKVPTDSILELAAACGVTVLTSGLDLFEASGILFNAGIQPA